MGGPDKPGHDDLKIELDDLAKLGRPRYHADHGHPPPPPGLSGPRSRRRLGVRLGTGENVSEPLGAALAVSLADIEAAAERIRGVAVEPPLLESPALNERLGLRVLLKAETLQRVGAFKFRGAYNRLVQ